MSADNPKRLVDELANVINTLHGIFDEIGLARYERESREASVYSAISAALHDQLRVVSQEKTKLVDECHQLISQIKQMERSMMDGDTDYNDDDDDSQITVPLLKCLQGLKEKQKMVKRCHAERYDSVKKLVHALDTYASRLEPSIIQIPLPPITNDVASIATLDLSHSYYERLEQEFNRIYQEFMRRVSTVEALAKDVINLYAELGIPTAQTDRTIAEYGATEPERLGLTKDDIERLQSKKSKLLDEKERRRTKTDDLKREISELWAKLGVDEGDRKLFLAQHRGYDMRTIQDLEDELHRLLELKQEHMHIFVEDARQTLHELWEKLYFSKDEILDFSPAHTDVYTDALLSAHEMEISRLEALLEERAPILNLVNKHRELMDEKEQLALSANDSSRLMSRGANGARDPTRLLREEKMRKRIAKELPRVEVELRKVLEKWEDDYGEPLLVKGENYLETLLHVSPVAQSRAATKTPVSGLTRGRSNTTSSLSNYSQNSQPRAKSRPNFKDTIKESNKETAPVKPPPRSKTPTARPKTPGVGGHSTFSYSGASTVGRIGGKNMASAIARTGTSQLGNIPSFGGIPRPLSCSASISPTRSTRPPLSTFSSGPNDRRELAGTPTLGRNASIKRKVGGPGTVPKMLSLQSEYQKPMMYQRHQYEHEKREEEDTQSRGNRSIRSVSPFGDDDQYRTYGNGMDEEDARTTPRANTYRMPTKNYMEYDSSRGSQTSSDSRQFSTSTISTLSSISTPGGGGSENWETYGDDSEYGDEMDPDPRTVYYRERAKSAYDEKSAGMVRQGGEREGRWMSETAF